MSIPADNKSCGIPVKIHPKSGDVERGMLYYNIEGPRFVPDSGLAISDIDEVKFSFAQHSIDSQVRICLKPELVVELDYAPDRISRTQMYPPSTDGWLTHVVDSGEKSLFSVHRVMESKKKLLTIVEKSSNYLFFAGLIQSYESSILEMQRDWNIHDNIMYGDLSEADIYAILERDSLSWPTLAALVEGVTIPNLRIGKTMKDTLDQLVPQSFSPAIRKQIMAFLAWLENAEIPKEDPADFFVKYRSVGVYGVLLRSHLQCMLDGVKPPSYVRLMHLADKGQIEHAQRPLSEADEQDPWTLFWFKLQELFPDWTGRVVQYANSLQLTGRVITELPVSRNNAQTSRLAWRDRFAMGMSSLFLRGHVHKEAIGLLPAIYVGSAHRWPHKHLEWTARLGYNPEIPRYIQIMVMPKSAFEQVIRIIPTIKLIEWEMSKYNLSLFSDSAGKWKLRSTQILKSLDRKRSIRQLANEFGSWKGKRYHQLTPVKARILDLVSWALYLSTLESGRYANYYGISNSQIKDELENMHAQGIFTLQYSLVPEKLRSLCIIANGPPENVCSLSRAFLMHAPSTQVRITDGGSSSFIVSRVPEDEFHTLVSALAVASNDSEVSTSVFPISAYAGYRNNLYSRLLKEDGSWDDDVSGLLSQVRLRPKDVN